MERAAVKVLIGVASGAGEAPDPRFLESLPPFYHALACQHTVGLKWVVGERLDAAQNELAVYALAHDYQYLLMLEDDHWGHTDTMFYQLLGGLDAQHPVVASNYHSRHYPHLRTLMRREGQKWRQNDEGVWCELFTEVRQPTGYAEVDLCGFGMMLIDCQVFARLSQPYFEFAEDALTTDDNFCKKLKTIGVRPLGCLDYVLPHRDYTPETVMTIRGQLNEDRTVFKIWRVAKHKQMLQEHGLQRLRTFLTIAKRGRADIAEQLPLIETIALSIRAKRFVELGTRKGVSLAALAAAALQTLGHVWTVDLLNLDIPWWTDGYAQTVTRLHADDCTVEIPQECQENGIDLLLIDSSHLSAHTAQELDRWGMLVNRGGVILLHDTKICSRGVEEPVLTWVKTHHLEYLHDNRRCGMGIVYVNKSLRPVLELQEVT